MLQFYKGPIFGDEIVLRSVDWLKNLPWSNEPTLITVKTQNDKFEINMQVKNFTPEQIKVKIVGDFVVIEGKHEEKKDCHGLIARGFVRKYVLPSGCRADKVKSTMSPDGTLNVVVPRDDGTGNHTVIPVLNEKLKPKSKL